MSEIYHISYIYIEREKGHLCPLSSQYCNKHGTLY